MWYTPLYNKKDVGKLENIAYTSSNLSNVKKQTTNHTLYPTIGLIAALSISPVLGLSCRNQTKKEKEATSVVAPREYTLQDLEAALGERWYSLNNEQKDKFKELWFTNDSDFRGYMVEAYGKPQESYDKLPEDRKKQFNAFTISELSKEEAKNYKEIFPWINIKNPTFSDKLLIFMLEVIGHIANLR